MFKRVNAILLLSLFALSLYAGGCSDPGGIGVSAKAGTLGVGGEISTKLLMNVNGRVGFNQLNLDYDGEVEDIDYDVDIDLRSFTAFLDWHVFLDDFRISAGALVNKNKICLDTTPATAVEIGSIMYTPAEVGTLRGSVDWDDIAPYFGIGWGDALDRSRRIGFTFDIGVAYTGSPNVDLIAANGTLSGSPAFRAALARERRDIEKELGAFKYYPVLSAGLFFRF
jgi:hypothetical protein